MQSSILLFGFLLNCSLLFVGAHHHPNHYTNQMVNVTVYYESLCPDSIKFFTQQLYPTMQTSLPHYINLNLIPFGKSSYHYNGNQYEFNCHHGQNECVGNQLHACAIRLIGSAGFHPTDAVDEGPYANDGGGAPVNAPASNPTLAYLNCLMDRAGSKALKLQTVEQGSKTDVLDVVFKANECANINRILNADRIQQCAVNSDGQQYLAHLGSITDQLQPKLKSVPFVTFNGVASEAANQQALQNFAAAVCGHLDGGGGAIVECAHYAHITSGAGGVPLSATLWSMAAVAVYLVLRSTTL